MTFIPTAIPANATATHLRNGFFADCPKVTNAIASMSMPNAVECGATPQHPSERKQVFNAAAAAATRQAAGAKPIWRKKNQEHKPRMNKQIGTLNFE